MFIVKVPGVNGLGRTDGCQKAGNAILSVLKEEISSNEEGKPIEFDKLDLEEIHLDNSDLELANKLIYENSFETYEQYPKVVFLGGDQSVSYSLTRAFFDYCETSGKEPCLIVFDAHPDLKNSLDRNFPTNVGWLKKLIEDGFPSKNILLVGIRSQTKEERAFLKEKAIKVISMNQLNENLAETCDSIMEFSSGKELYVSLDIDVIDPCFAPSTAYPEPGGLTSRQIIYLMQRINKIKNLKALDIVEIKEDTLTVKLGAKILSELI